MCGKLRGKSGKLPRFVLLTNYKGKEINFTKAFYSNFAKIHAVYTVYNYE